jgi:hypothetical protein
MMLRSPTMRRAGSSTRGADGARSVPEAPVAAVFLGGLPSAAIFGALRGIDWLAALRLFLLLVLAVTEVQRSPWVMAELWRYRRHPSTVLPGSSDGFGP